MKENSKGQSLWEVVIALGLASIVAVGLVKVSTTSVKSSRYSADQSAITALAQKKIAQIVEHKNKNPNLFWAGQYYPTGFVNPDFGTTGYCLLTRVSDSSSDLPTAPPGLPVAKMFLINVKVYWDEIGLGTQCNNKNFIHVLNFDTYVTN